MQFESFHWLSHHGLSIPQKNVPLNYFIPCFKNGRYSQCDIRAAHDGKVGRNTVEYIYNHGFPV